jgi:hypothetical protein
VAQQELFPAAKSEPKKTLVISSKDAQNEYLHYLRTDNSLWDMRCWNKYHDLEEVKAWVENPEDCKNTGHGHYCILQLKEAGIPNDTIVASIMANLRISYSKRLCPCWLIDPKEHCERFKKAGNYSDCQCELCHNNGGIKHDSTRKNP